MAYYYQDSAHKHAVTHLGGTSSSYQKYWYDANGNQIKRKVGSSSYNYLAYAAENRLTSVSGAASAAFVYDGNHVKAPPRLWTAGKVSNHANLSKGTDELVALWDQEHPQDQVED